MSLKEEQLSAIKAVYEGRAQCLCLFDMGRSSATKLSRWSVIMSALIAILTVSKDNIGTEECLCRDNLLFCAPEAVTTAKWRDVLEREQFSSRIVAISVDEAHCVSKW